MIELKQGLSINPLKVTLINLRDERKSSSQGDFVLEVIMEDIIRKVRFDNEGVAEWAYCKLEEAIRAYHFQMAQQAFDAASRERTIVDQARTAYGDKGAPPDPVVSVPYSKR